MLSKSSAYSVFSASSYLTRRSLIPAQPKSEVDACLVYSTTTREIYASDRKLSLTGAPPRLARPFLIVLRPHGLAIVGRSCRSCRTLRHLMQQPDNCKCSGKAQIQLKEHRCEPTRIYTRSPAFAKRSVLPPHVDLLMQCPQPFTFTSGQDRPN